MPILTIRHMTTYRYSGQSHSASTGGCCVRATTMTRRCLNLSSSGSCRDLAILMIAALRSLGIAARFVSGYLHLTNHDDDRVTGGNTHAWVQAYVPASGWVDFDPSSGMVGNQNLVRVAVVRGPEETIPLQGTWIGAAEDHLAMNVAVKVTAADGR
jgi:transglutaminase-like putative cysteine protease